MMRAYYFLRLALHNLLRGGQRVLVALLCITFGVMALVAMTMLSKSVEGALVLAPGEIFGGDLSLGNQSGAYILPGQVDQLQALQQAGKIDRFTLIAYNSSLTFHLPGSGELHFIYNAYGVTPDEYPVIGTLSIGQPGSTSLPALSSLLEQVGDVVITRDLAQEYNLKLGDPIVLADLRFGTPVQGVIRGIAYDTPNHLGSKIYYTVATAQRLANSQQVFTVAMVNAADPGTLGSELSQSGWSVSFASGVAKNSEQTTNFIILCLRGAGILGLLVGGIGIANTMQVLLRRRQGEIAIWKTLGYREGHLRVMFSLEAGLLGLAGGLLGAGLGVLVSGQLLELFRRTSNLLYGWSFSIVPPLMGVLAGTLSTVIFATWAIVVASQAQPMALLRNEPVDVRRLPRWKSAALALLLAMPFTALASLVMGSLLNGIGVLLFCLAGVALLGGFFAALLWACSHWLPLHSFPIVRMALNSLGRRGMGLVFAMIALFVGILSMSLGLVVTENGQREISARSIDIQGYNLNIIGSAGQESAIQQAVQAQGPEKVAVGYRTALKSLRQVGNAAAAEMSLVLVGRSDPDEYVLSGAAWGSQPGGVYVPQWAGLKAGSQVEATFWDGTTVLFPVIGTYGINYRPESLYPPDGLLLDAQAFNRAARPDAVTYFVRVAPGQVGRAAAALGAALPQASVVNLVAYAARFVQTYQNLFILAMAMAGLALLAGILLVANSVSLAMLDRRYEIGILKTVGYARRQILFIFAVEYGVVGLLATGAGVGVVQVFMWGLALVNHLASGLLQMNLLSIAMIAACGIGLTLLTVAGVTWAPTRVSPAVVLNERNG
jgi:putative ABC transport system permease protein